MKDTLQQYKERKQVIPVLLDVAEIEIGDYIEITIKKIKSSKR